jgi:hypothetical protein
VAVVLADKVYDGAGELATIAYGNSMVSAVELRDGQGRPGSVTWTKGATTVGTFICPHLRTRGRQVPFRRFG